MKNPDRNSSSGQILPKIASAVLLLLLLTGVLLTVKSAAFPDAREVSFRKVLRGLSNQDGTAQSLIESHVEQFPADPAGNALAAELAARVFDNDRAVTLYRKLPRDGGAWEVLADLGLAQRYRVMGLMLEEEACLRNVLALQPGHMDANHRLGHLLQVQGRTWESAECFLSQLRRGRCRGDELMGVATTERFFRADDKVDFSAKNAKSPQAISELGDARRLLFQNRNDEAEVLLRKIVAESPHIGEAQGRLGRLIVERGQLKEFLTWRGLLPASAMRHPDVWFVQGLQARRSGLTEGAICCFLQAIRLSPNHLPANVQMAGCLSLTGDSEAARFFTHRSEQLSELEAVLNILRTQVDEPLILKAVSRLAELNRYWEAAGWLYVLSTLDLPADPSRPRASQYAALALADPSQNAGFSEQLEALSLDRYPEPNWNLLFAPSSSGSSYLDLSHAEPSAGRQDSSLSGNDRTTAEVRLSLNDDAESVGISMKYFEGTSEANRLEHIFSVVGGGIAALDFDLDGWPDLHIAQANDWRNPEANPDLIDSLYRNVRGQRFTEVTRTASLIEPGFSHGVCSEDFDQDGFPDILVCNLHGNRLFRNLGDGSFQDVTEIAGIAGAEWSVGAVMADFNGDGLPDIYVGNYSTVEETSQKICHRSNGQQMACTPDVLTAESDRLYLNSGDTRFQDITEVSGVRENSGRALGMIGWDFTGNGRISLFVANDTSANFFLHNISVNQEGIPQFQEEGILRGLAFDADGNAQASMGVAASDANHDGRIDLFVTNFASESNTFYTQGVDGSFYDFTRQLELRDAGFAMLGFGTQFVDLDGDGWEDLAATNGHVDQSLETPGAERMKPQIFRSLNGESYAEIPAEDCGSYFSKVYLGRALATLDWNRDGRPDFAVSHIHSPFSLVSNRTPWTSDAIILKLIARSGVREATGARVRVRMGGRDSFRFALAGDGYLVTNESVFSFAIPSGQSIDEIEVTWPNGTSQTWSQVSSLVNTETALVEGRNDPLLLKPLSARRATIE